MRRLVPRGAVALALLAAAVVAALVLSLGFGAVGLDPAQLAAGLFGHGDPAAVAIVRDLRLPRAVLAALVGGALGLAGATFQALLRNPLADPYVLGVSSGAAIGAVAVISLVGAAPGSWVLSGGALLGALFAIGLVHRVASRFDRGLDLRVLLLAGVVAGSFFNACILLVLSFQPADAFRAAMFWMMGGLAGASWPGVLLLAVILVPALVALLALGRSFDLLALGAEPAAYLGTPVERVQRTAYVVASLLTAAAVVTAGGVGFVGLVVPHAVRLVWGAEHRFLLPATFLAGAAFLPLADLAARTAAAPGELPLGVVTAFVGVPFFIALLRRQVARGAG